MIWWSPDGSFYVYLFQAKYCKSANLSVDFMNPQESSHQQLYNGKPKVNWDGSHFTPVTTSLSVLHVIYMYSNYRVNTTFDLKQSWRDRCQDLGLSWCHAPVWAPAGLHA